MIGKEAKAVFIPTDQRLEVLTYRWIINGSNYMMTNNSSIQFIPAKVGIISIELHVFDNVSHSTGTFKQFVECKGKIDIYFSLFVLTWNTIILIEQFFLF